jgi:ankyrin repeat protein
MLLDCKIDIDHQDNDGNTALHQAVGMGQVEFIKLLLLKGVNVHASNNDGFTPLHVAAMNEYPILANLLLTHGADPYHKNNKDQSSIDIARKNVRSTVLPLLEPTVTKSARR